MNKFNKHVIVVGSARSGTSWLSETLAQPFRYRMLFEPDQETRTKRGHLLCDQWLTSKTDSPEAYAYLKSVFKNRVDCDWIAQNSNRKFKQHLWPLVPKKFIIKFVRCNLSAQYMNERFGIPVIHLIRNPYDTIRSQQQVKFPWFYDLSKFTREEKLVQLIKEEFNYDLHSIEHLSDVELLTLRWCIENVVALEVLQPNTDSFLIVRYEDLLGGKNVFYEICETLNLEPVSDLEKRYKLPSSKTHPNGAFYKKSTPNSFSEETLVKINNILDIFNTSLYKRTN